MSEFKRASEPTYCVDIFVAGDQCDIKRQCQRFCERGLCVTVTPTTYVYTHAAKTGARIGLINYPRFPKGRAEIDNLACELAVYLLKQLSQGSCCVVTPDQTIWISRRERA